MNKERREKLIKEVRIEYENFIHSDAQQHFHQTTIGITPEAYYGSLCENVSRKIVRGSFDNCKTGREIVNKVAADKKLLE